MTFTPPVTEQRFVLDHIAGIGQLAEHELFAEASSDLVDAILEGIGQLAAGEWAPLNWPGDESGGAKLTEDGVKMPEGFQQAYRDYVEGGWGTISAPADFGGQGLPFSLGSTILESLGSANMAFTLCPILSGGAIEALTHHGSEELQRLYLPKLCTGEWTGTMNLTEPQAGSDVGALKTKAERAEDGSWRITGQKIFITFGEHDLTDNIVHLVLARTPDAPAGTKGISLFLVPRYRLDEDGNPDAFNDVRCVSLEEKLGIHASPTCVMSYGDDGDCHGWLIGPEHGGMRAMFTMMNNARINVGMQGVQIGERATQQAVSFARERVQSARAGGDSRDAIAIIGHPDVRRMLMRMKALTQAARALVYYTAGQVDRGTLGDADAKARAELLTPLAKAYGSDCGVEIASLGVQVHGGMGYVEETGAAQHYRDARIAPIYEGTNGIQAADLVGRKLGLAGGDTVRALFDEIRADGGDHAALDTLLGDCEATVNWLTSGEASVDDRLAASYPLLTMMSVLVGGWLMARQWRIAKAQLATGEGDNEFLDMKIAAARFYLDQIVPEASGLAAAATARADVLYSVTAEAFGA
ncbi:acyl-CoA dehydrogenase family protein [uncultured Parasphingopyxis sp.]|uniref:acyl-CoA dehydrogenase family protein n=1 Tax=uncultured Parasphingopyxis sp. TaxID=1547918 RepID=UPI002620B6F4|nr:acyl-CoA dehydrogenase family protein [uncultured Parasphingopyxis sp.]